jgi:hypothetical protein
MSGNDQVKAAKWQDRKVKMPISHEITRQG